MHNNTLSAVQHLDPTGNPSASQQDSDLVNALGQNTQYTDGNVQQYSFDVLSRITADVVTTAGSGLEGRFSRPKFFAEIAIGQKYIIW